MNIANKSQFWTSRMNGEDPTALGQINHNDEFSQSGTGAGRATVSGWKINA